jgi:hypothetical protein
MEKVNEYRSRAEECRRLATIAPSELKKHYIQLAVMWDRLAGERLTFFIPSDQQRPENGQEQEEPDT